MDKNFIYSKAGFTLVEREQSERNRNSQNPEFWLFP